MLGFEIFTDHLFVGSSMSFIGSALIAIAVINVHAHIVHEHKIDADVLKAMKRERRVAFLGFIFITIGYMLEMSHFGYIF